MKSLPLMSMLFATALLAGCYGDARPVAAAPSGDPVALASVRMAAGKGSCGDELSRFERLLKSDLDTGNVNKSVYDQMERELSSATRACDAGHDGDAITIMRATKARHGYRADA